MRMEKFTDRQKKTDLLNDCIWSLFFFRNRQNKTFYTFVESFLHQFFVHCKDVIDNLILSSNADKVLDKVFLKVD